MLTGRDLAWISFSQKRSVCLGDQRGIVAWIDGVMPKTIMFAPGNGGALITTPSKYITHDPVVIDYPKIGDEVHIFVSGYIEGKFLNFIEGVVESVNYEDCTVRTKHGVFSVDCYELLYDYDAAA